MNRRFWLPIVLVFVLIALFACIGASAFNAGIAQGVAQSGRLETPPQAPSQGVAPYPYPYPYRGPFFFRPFGWGFGLFGLLVPLFLLFLFFGLFRAIFWHRRWGRYGPRGDWGQGVPPAFEEWHRRAHEPKPQER